MNRKREEEIERKCMGLNERKRETRLIWHLIKHNMPPGYCLANEGGFAASFIQQSRFGVSLVWY